MSRIPFFPTVIATGIGFMFLSVVKSIMQTTDVIVFFVGYFLLILGLFELNDRLMEIREEIRNEKEI